MAALALIGLAACGDAGAEQGATRAQILNANGDVLLEVAIWVAETEDELREGLRRYPPLAQDEGLLLLFPVETTICITNTGVPYPIDVVYASADRQVIAVETIPADAPGHYCHPQTAMALELQGGALRSTNPVKLQLF
ncbi:MAG: DUF192 domain-containing protein [Myxococcales bacterium]|nr:DUF192 domain-containing protein [Myxococcales bacterium]MDH3485348.1 DUF192 domain-containing protein [Myxococcales bacterium]